MDRVFDAQGTTDEIYKELVTDLLSFAKSGGIATLLAYGQTGSGKTFTISQLQKLAAMSLMDEALNAKDQTEIYITISDLAGNSAFDLLDSRKPVSVLQDSSGVTHLVGANEYRVEAIDQVLGLLEQSASFRRTESTKRNDASSRSHSICRIRIQNSSVSNSSADDGVLYLVDLTGSEAARDVAEHGADRMRETKEINISLSVLKDCLRGKAEIEIARREGREKKVHVPIRQSTLTRVLKHVFDPEENRPCKTVVIACVNPSLADVGPSKNTLRYAEMLGDIGG
jgi:kinesin family protein 2/24